MPQFLLLDKNKYKIALKKMQWLRLQMRKLFAGSGSKAAP